MDRSRSAWPSKANSRHRRGGEVRIEPAHLEAYATISKAQCEFPRILEAYDAVETYVKGHGMDPAGSPREVYFVDFNAVGPDDPFVDIAWPAVAVAARV